MVGLRVWCPTALVVLLAVSASDACAQGRLDARYGIAIAGISVGEARWQVDIGGSRYSVSAGGGAGAWLKVLLSGQGDATTQGLIQNGIPYPLTYSAKMTSDDEASVVRMSFEEGNVKDLTVADAKPARDRVPVTDADRKGVMDPLTALLIPMPELHNAANSAASIGDETCRRKLAIFDGRRRFDLRLTFKRIEQVTAERGYRGPAVVCGLTFHPVSGHRPSSTLTRYLADGRDIELWLAPIAGTLLSAPFRVTITNLIGSLTINATRWETALQPRDGTPVVAGPQGRAARPAVAR